ncbi:hypothetical protein HPB50_016221 [Hyalomma asiaticum]|uniref:Uncharacterized protein n=1 Tax=Hyalomma asiaticum TaxID=266040 RepID=A0ACB7RUH5_HYAAI|nr:hypothetical protein HPB50_016221 [Hyalomma asiaticum]
MGSLNEVLLDSDTSELANSLLCFLLCGLHARFRIPVGYFFTRRCTGALLAETTKHVIKKTEELGFEIARIVSDNHKTNVAAMEILSRGQPQTRVPHPTDPSRSLFLAFHQSHIIKNVRSQFLARKFGRNGEISSIYIKDLYKMQQGSILKPVRFLTRKHLYPSNIEKMGVKPAVQLFSPAVRAALSFMKDHAGHTCDAKFADAGPTVEFMKNMCRWFTLMDVSNCQQHIHHNHPDTKEFYDPEDSRLHWLELVFLEYIEDLKATSAPQNFITKETHHALVFTTVSNVQCIRFRLHRGFKFALTRKFSSDPIESLFGTLRRRAGCNDMLDVRSALSGLEKMLKTGIVAASSTSNVHSSSSFFCSGNIIVSGKPSSMPSTSAAASSKSAAATVNSAQQLLRELCTSTKPFLPTPDMAAISLVAGYISRVVTEKIECGRCVSLVTKAKGSSTGALDGLIAHQDRGGLCYPTPELDTRRCTSLEYSTANHSSIMTSGSLCLNIAEVTESTVMSDLVYYYLLPDCRHNRLIDITTGVCMPGEHTTIQKPIVKIVAWKISRGTTCLSKNC